MLFCVAHTGIDDVAPAAHLDPVYAETLRRVCQAGVEVLAYACDVERETQRPVAIGLGRALPVSLQRELAASSPVD